MKSTFLPQWNVFYSFIVVEWNVRSFSLKYCCESVFSTVKKSKLCCIYTWQSMHSPCSHKFWAARRHLQRGPRGPWWTWADDFYVTHTRADPCRHADIENMNRLNYTDCLQHVWTRCTISWCLLHVWASRSAHYPDQILQILSWVREWKGLMWLLNFDVCWCMMSHKTLNWSCS